MSASHIHSSHVGGTAYRSGYNSDSRGYPSGTSVTRYRSKSVDDSKYRGGYISGGYGSYSGGGYKSNGGGRYSSSGRYDSYGTAGRYPNRGLGGGYSSSKVVSVGSHGHSGLGTGSTSRSKNVDNHAQTSYTVERNERNISDTKAVSGTAEVECRSGAGGGNHGGSKTQYKIVGRLTRSPSPDKVSGNSRHNNSGQQRYSTGLILPDLSGGGGVGGRGDVCDTEFGKRGGVDGRGGKLKDRDNLVICGTGRGGDRGLPRRDGYGDGDRDHDNGGRYPSDRGYGHGYRGRDYGNGECDHGDVGRDYGGKGRYPGADDDCNDYAGARGRPRIYVGGDGGRGRSPYRRPYSNDHSYDGGPSHHKPILRNRPQSADRVGDRVSPSRRSRSLNDLYRSLSPRKRSAITPDGQFPVCSRFPNCSVCTIDIPQNQPNKEQVVHNMQVELKEEVENIAMLEKKDKEIHLKSESISQITQILQKTRKELELKIVECNRRDAEVKQLKQELKNVLNDKKNIEFSYSEQKITVSKLETTETRLAQMTDKCDQLVIHNQDLIDRVKTLEIAEKEFIELERNVIDLQVQLRDMEDLELHRDELFQKLQYVKKQRDDFLEKGRIVEEERNEFVRSNKSLEQYIMDWKRKTAEFKKTNQALKDRILSLERDKKDLETRIVNIQQERTSLQIKIGKIEVERDDYIRELREVTLERNTLEARLADLEDMLSDQDHLEEGFHSLRLKVAELTRQRDDAVMIIPSYKAKVQLLKKTAREKEDSIMQLTHELKTLKIALGNSSGPNIARISPESKSHHHHDKPIKAYFSDKEPDLSIPLKHYRDLDVMADSDSYDQVTVPRYDTYSDDSIFDDRYLRKRRKNRGVKHIALFDYDPYRSSTSDHPERELRLKEGDYVTVYGEMDVDGYLEAELDGVHGLVPSMYVEEFSDDGRVDVVRPHRHRVTQMERRFEVLYDYDPYTMGTTDQPDLQLSLRKGDVILVIGDIDVDGYYTAIFKGKRGLVPSNFVREHSQHSHTSSHGHDHAHGRSNKSNFQGTIEIDDVAGPPYAPSDLKVLRVVTRNAVLLGWQLPRMDEYGKSNNCRVTGYRLWVNGKMKQECNSPTMTKALVEDVDLRNRVEFSIQTVGESGFCSEKCHFAITGALTALENDDEIDSGSNMYVALYDYDPFKSSPNPNPSLELELREGTLIKVYDTSRSDGFYGAEINGKRGLVPSNFVERVTSGGGGGSGSGGSGGGSSSHHHTSSHHSSTQNDSDSNRRVQFKKSTK